MVKTSKATIFLDIDGVLCDMVSGAEYLYDKKFDFKNGPRSIAKQLGITQYELSVDLDQSKFWTDLKPTPYLQEIFEILRMYNLYSKTVLCSEGVLMPEAMAGRLRWIQEHCRDFYQRKDYIIIKDKYLLAGRNKILIDDYDKACQKFRNAGGWAIDFQADWKPRRGKLNPVVSMKLDLDNILIGEKDGET